MSNGKWQMAPYTGVPKGGGTKAAGAAALTIGVCDHTAQRVQIQPDDSATVLSESFSPANLATLCMLQIVSVRPPIEANIFDRNGAGVSVEEALSRRATMWNHAILSLVEPGGHKSSSERGQPMPIWTSNENPPRNGCGRNVPLHVQNV